MSFLELLIRPLIEIMKCLSAPVVHRIVYIKDLRTNFEMLNEKARDLFIKRDDVKTEIDGHGTRKVATRDCENWLNKVEKIEHQVNEIEKEYNREDGRCLRRQCLNIQSQWKLGKRMVVTINRISDLIEECNSLRQKVVDAFPQVAETIPVPTINIETSTYHTLCEILESVRNPKRHKIGIWGMGGVGKTTVMKYLNNRPELKQIFEIVIWVTVSKDCSIRKIQQEIAHRLLLELSDDESDERVARKLYEHLETRRFLLLMDDVWDKVDLDDVGVACPNQNGSKVVFMTRYLKVCKNMLTNEEIKVKPLSSNEAWKLFHEKAGEVIDLPNIHPVARSVVAECAGLPLAVIAIGASLRMEGDIHVWNVALKELSSPATSNMEDMEDQVFKSLRFSFDRLKDDNLRNCFLYAALFPEDYEIQVDEIIEYWMVEGFISSLLNLIEARNKGYAILKQLIDASLLEESIYDTERGSKRVKMHDIIRDLALKITSAEREGCKFFVRAGTMTEQPPENKEWEQVERTSLMENQLSKLPERPCCPTLLTLMLQHNRQLITIPESFFETMHSLRVLDLSGTDIESLPPSICNLVSLRGLYLRYCLKLKTLPPEIGALTSLEMLDLSSTIIMSLPPSIRNLVSLRGLYLKKCWMLVTLPPGVGELTSLEVLDAGGYGRCKLPSEIGNLSHLRVLKYASNGTMPAGGTIRRLSLLEQLITPTAFGLPVGYDTLIEDICCLKILKSLGFYFLEVKHLEFFIRKSSLWKEGSMAFSFVVGANLISRTGDEELDKKLTFSGGESIPNAIVEVLGYANLFNLHRHRSIRKLCEIGVGNMNGLRYCIIADCDEMEIVLDGAQITDIALPNLETLDIYWLRNLKSVWNDPLPLGSLACLKLLNVSGCDKLEKIFSRKTIQQLPNLEYLRVESCSSLTEVIHEEAGGMMFDCILPKLRYLTVFFLPSLVSILKSCYLSCPSLEEIEVRECPKLKRLPQGIDKASNLQKIRCDEDGIWWDELEWDDNAIKLQLQLLVSREFFF